ncbi:hypothetical protein BU107_12935 [Staphylococcus xylosus]|uniref:hypothetical protein n=1 Tax=Staphylococcus xylosus TaxID=1288 RepID=UPI000E67CD35|nr:hypothetical protein [Staphylococcus xylosus]RIM85060.1 hypothetical protein BU107_12935 [Staphylococcus xylosus]
MSRKIIELKKGDTIIFQKKDDEISYLGRVIEIPEDHTNAIVESENTTTKIDNSYNIFKVY